MESTTQSLKVAQEAHISISILLYFAPRQLIDYFTKGLDYNQVSDLGDWPEALHAPAGNYTSPLDTVWNFEAPYGQNIVIRDYIES